MAKLNPQEAPKGCSIKLPTGKIVIVKDWEGLDTPTPTVVMHLEGQEQSLVKLPLENAGKMEVVVVRGAKAEPVAITPPKVVVEPEKPTETEPIAPPASDNKYLEAYLKPVCPETIPVAAPRRFLRVFKGDPSDHPCVDWDTIINLTQPTEIVAAANILAVLYGPKDVIAAKPARILQMGLDMIKSAVDTEG